MTELRATEWLARVRPSRWETHTFIHIRTGSTKQTKDPLRIGMHMDVMACGRKSYVAEKMPGARDANRATCRRCLERYQPKRGQPPVASAGAETP